MDSDDEVPPTLVAEAQDDDLPPTLVSGASTAPTIGDDELKPRPVPVTILTGNSMTAVVKCKVNTAIAANVCVMCQNLPCFIM